MVLPPRRGKVLNFVQVIARHASCEFHESHDHGEGGAFDGNKRLVHVDAHSISDVEEFLALVGAKDAAHDLDQELLGVTSAKVEADRLENQSLKSNDDFTG